MILNRVLIAVFYIFIASAFAFASDIYPTPATHSWSGVYRWGQPRIASGTALPALASASEGDLFLLATDSPKLYRRQGAEWENITGIDPTGAGIASTAFAQALDPSVFGWSTETGPENQTGYFAATPATPTIGIPKVLPVGILDYDGKAWVIGGSGYVSYSSDLGESWTTATTTAGYYSGAAGEKSAVVFDSKMWVFDVELGTSHFSNSGSGWSVATTTMTLPARTLVDAVVFDDKIWVVGGYDLEADLTSTIYYTTDGINWTLATDTPAFGVRAGHSTFVHDGKLWIVGGYGPGWDPADAVPYYSTDGVNWINAGMSSWTYENDDNFSAVSYDGKIVLVSTKGATAYFRTSSDGVSWETRATPPWSGGYSAVLGLIDGGGFVLAASNGSVEMSGLLSSPGETLRHFVLPTEIATPTAEEGMVWFDGAKFRGYASGTWEDLNGERYEDLQFPIAGVNPVGPSTAPSVDNEDGLWTFSGTADNVAALQVQMPHSWIKFTAIKPHAHILNSAAATGTIRLRLEYKIANVHDDFPAAWASETLTITVANSTATHQLFSFTDIDMTGKGHSAILKMRLSRLAASDAIDDYTSAVKLCGFDLHYLRKTLGSINSTGD
jgi:hypothetical protein